MDGYQTQARLMKALQHPVRLAILNVIAGDEACVCHLSAALRASQPTVSQHLMLLRKAGLVASRREGKNVYYRLADPQVPALLNLLNRVANTPLNLNPTGRIEGCPCPHCQEGNPGSSDEAANHRTPAEAQQI